MKARIKWIKSGWISGMNPDEEWGMAEDLMSGRI
jgi:hypothetical protein